MEQGYKGGARRSKGSSGWETSGGQGARRAENREAHIQKCPYIGGHLAFYFKLNFKHL